MAVCTFATGLPDLAVTTCSCSCDAAASVGFCRSGGTAMSPRLDPERTDADIAEADGVFFVSHGAVCFTAESQLAADAYSNAGEVLAVSSRNGVVFLSDPTGEQGATRQQVPRLDCKTGIDPAVRLLSEDCIRRRVCCSHRRAAGSGPPRWRRRHVRSSTSVSLQFTSHAPLYSHLHIPSCRTQQYQSQCWHMLPSPTKAHTRTTESCRRSPPPRSATHASRASAWRRSACRRTGVCWRWRLSRTAPSAFSRSTASSRPAPRCSHLPPGSCRWAIGHCR